MELWNIWNIVWRRKWIVLQAFLLVLVSAVVTSYLIPPKYETKSKLIIEASNPAESILSSIGLSDLSDLIPFGTSSDTTVKNTIALATIEPNIKQVIALLQLRDTDGNLRKASDLLKSNIIISTFTSKPYLEATEVEDTDIIEIRSLSSDPDEAAMIANTVAEIFLEENLNQRRGQYKSAKLFIDEQIKKAKKEYLETLEEIKDFKIKHQTVDLAIESKVAIEKIAELMQQKEDNIIDIAEVEAKIDTLQRQLAKESDTNVSGSAISENPYLETVKRKLLELETQLAQMLTEKTSEHIDVRILREQIGKAKAELKKEMAFYKGSSKDMQLLERELAALRVHLTNVNADIEKYLSLLYTIPDKAVIDAQLKSKLTVSQELYGALLEYLYQVGVAEAMTLSDIRLADAAVAPPIDEPISPNIYLNASVAGFLGLILGLALCFLVDYLDDTIKTPEDAKQYADFTFLGSIIKFSAKESPLIADKDPKDPICESYRTLRNNIRFSTLGKSVKSLLVSSSMENEGKTTTVVNLAISISREEKRVLIVDADLRKPRVHQLFGLSNSAGLTNVLTDGTDMAQVIQTTGIPGVSVLMSGPVPPDPGQMIESENMAELIKQLSERYDMIIVDSPPVLIANDAIVLAGCCDSAILVLESRRATRGSIANVAEHLDRANVKLTGMVLNKLSIEAGGYYGYYYKSGYYNLDK